MAGESAMKSATDSAQKSPVSAQRNGAPEDAADVYRTLNRDSDWMRTKDFCAASRLLICSARRVSASV